jgi:transcription elongation factor GreB
MGRWRPPPSPSSPYITAAGQARLQAELRDLWDRRAEVTRHLAAAAAEGDRSENAEYIYRKKELRGIDARIRYLQKRLPDLKVVTGTPAGADRIFFGAWLTLARDNGPELVCRIVGADEIDPEHNRISVDSPLARALLRRTFGDEVVVHTANGSTQYTVVDIRYDEPAD